MTKHIYLTGMMGSGKTTIAKLVAKKLHRNFYDLDAIIEENIKMRISDIFKKKGEDYFRIVETKTLDNVAATKKDAIISCGGGVILKEENIRIMNNSGTIIYINRSIKNIEKTVDMDKRPLLKNGSFALYTIFEQREELYKKTADYIVDNNKEISEAVNRVAALIASL